MALIKQMLLVLGGGLTVFNLAFAEDNGIYLDQSYFDVSLPATYERCQDTQGMELYLASLGAQDVDKLKNFNAFLIGCQALLQDRIAKTKEQVAKLEKEKK